MQQPNDSAATSAATADTRDGPYQSSARRRQSNRRPTTLPALNQVAPQPFVDPIARVKRESIHWKRKVFHVIGIGCVALTYAFTSVERLEALAILGAVAAIFCTLDMARFYIPSLNKKVRQDFGPFMRDYELNSLSGSTWFFFSSLIAIGLFPKTAASLGFLCLALGDPLASWVGLRWGKTRLPGGKSLEGSLTFFAVSALAGVLSLALNPAVTLAVGPMVALACVVAIAGAFAEWLPIKGVDDNFVVPILAGGAGAAVLAFVA